MLTAKGPRILEYNARFGDPETQVVLARMKNDIVEVFEACIDGTLHKIDLQFEDNAALCVVVASDGYPEKYEKENICNHSCGFGIRALTGTDYALARR
jgi:phosphoribosylamine--glycine ligase